MLLSYLSARLESSDAAMTWLRKLFSAFESAEMQPIWILDTGFPLKILLCPHPVHMLMKALANMVCDRLLYKI